MTGREALKALADGKRVRHVGWNERSAYLVIDTDGTLVTKGLNSTPWSYETVATHPGPFRELSEQLATDEELIAEMERLAGEHRHTAAMTADEAYTRCARMLRERKVKP